MNKPKAAIKLLMVLAPVLMSLTLLGAGLRYNTTESLPVGFYWIDYDAPTKVGDIIIFCPDNRPAFTTALERGYISRGLCPYGSGNIFKKILAAKNDVITIVDAGVFINGNYIADSKPAAADPAGSPLPQFRPNQYTLKDGEFFLMSQLHPLSFDSRYFGLIYHTDIGGVATPVF